MEEDDIVFCPLLKSICIKENCGMWNKDKAVSGQGKCVFWSIPYINAKLGHIMEKLDRIK